MGEAAADEALAQRPAGRPDLQQRRKADSCERLLDAAAAAFCARGYLAVSVDDIASAAGVSRMTFYRHFSGKPALASELFRRSAEAAMPQLLSIGGRDYRDRRVVRAWIGELFADDRARGRLLRVFTQAIVDGPEFTEDAHAFMARVIAELGRTIPAFALDRDQPGQRRRWVEAWLLLYELFDQSNHAARGLGVATDPLTIEILADRFAAFVGG